MFKILIEPIIEYYNDNEKYDVEVNSFWEEIKVYKNFRISTQVVVSSVASVVFPGVYDTLFLGSYQKLYRML